MRVLMQQGRQCTVMQHWGAFV